MQRESKWDAILKAVRELAEPAAAAAAAAALAARDWQLKYTWLSDAVVRQCRTPCNLIIA